MGAFSQIAASAVINLSIALVWFFLYAYFSKQPFNSRVYFGACFRRERDARRRASAAGGQKWAHDSSDEDEDGKEEARRRRQEFVLFVGPKGMTEWLYKAVTMPEDDLLEAAGVDAVVFLRMMKLGLKLFVPMAVFGCAFLVPIYTTGGYLEEQAATTQSFTYDPFDTASISNIGPNSSRLLAVDIVVWAYSVWVYYLLWMNYKRVAELRLGYLAQRPKQADEYSILLRQIPHRQNFSIRQNVERFYAVNYPNTYLCCQVVRRANKAADLVRALQNVDNKLDRVRITIRRGSGKRPKHKLGFLGLWGRLVDSEEFYVLESQRLELELAKEQKSITENPKYLLRAAFVSFNSRWGGAIAAQTQPSDNHQEWIPTWAPERRDVFWRNLPIPYWQLPVRRFAILFAVFLLSFFYMVPITFVQSVANLQSLQSLGGWVKTVVSQPVVAAFIQGYLPALILSTFFAILPGLLSWWSRLEGWPSYSTINRYTASKLLFFNIVNIFFGTVFVGSLFGQLQSFVDNPRDIPQILGSAIPQKATFFMSYIMLQGWQGFPRELLRPLPLLLFHIRNALAITDRDHMRAMNLGAAHYSTLVPDQILFFIIGLVYAPIAPLLLLPLVVYFVFGYVVWANQLANVYVKSYETCGSFWPVFHSRVLLGVFLMQLCVNGIMLVKFSNLTFYFVPVLPFLTYAFYLWSHDRFRHIFKCYSIEAAMRRDTIDSVVAPTVSLLGMLQDAYLHPTLRRDARYRLVEDNYEDVEPAGGGEKDDHENVVKLKDPRRQLPRGKASASSSVSGEPPRNSAGEIGQKNVSGERLHKDVWDERSQKNMPDEMFDRSMPDEVFHDVMSRDALQEGAPSSKDGVDVEQGDRDLGSGRV